MWFGHLNASLLISQGVDVKTVQTCLGHNDANTTLSIYAHSFQEAQARAMDSVANSIYGKNSPENNLSEPSDANCVKQRFQIVVTANKGQNRKCIKAKSRKPRICVICGIEFWQGQKGSKNRKRMFYLCLSFAKPRRYAASRQVASSPFA